MERRRAVRCFLAPSSDAPPEEVAKTASAHSSTWISPEPRSSARALEIRSLDFAGAVKTRDLQGLALSKSVPPDARPSSTTAVIDPLHGGDRPFHEKSSCITQSSLRLLQTIKWLQLHEDIRGNETRTAHRVDPSPLRGLNQSTVAVECRPPVMLSSVLIRYVKCFAWIIQCGPDEREPGGVEIHPGEVIVWNAPSGIQREGIQRERPPGRLQET